MLDIVKGWRSAKSLINKTPTVHEHRLSARLGGCEVSAFTDIGASANFISLHHVRDHGYSINFAARKSVKTSVSTTINIIGTVKLPFAFKGETQSYQLEFNVIRKAARKVTMGSQFLFQILMARFEQLQHLAADRSRSQRTYTASEPFIRAQLNETEISAFPDTGAAANFMSLHYANNHGLKLDRASSSYIRLGNGSTVSTVGTTTSVFSFTGEKAAHTLIFNVLRTSVHDVVLGSPFLKTTKTLTRYAHRIGRRSRDALSHRVCALGTPQRVSGRLNGVHVDALPDTGAELSLMSASFASQQGFEINTDAQHCVLLEFADGSTANATGLVKDLKWKYGGSEVPCRIDVYVLPELSVDLLLGDEFLVKTDAFVAHEDQFWSGDDVETQDMADEKAIVWVFWIIKLVRKAVKHRRSLGQRMLSSYCSVSRHQELTQMRRQSESIFFEQP
jgi:predicted aspartyl protease